MRVRSEDREEHVNQIFTALRMVGININYETAELIVLTLGELTVKGGEFSIKDAAKLEADWQARWEKYHKPKEKED